jgi:hypothetical protein
MGSRGRGQGKSRLVKVEWRVGRIGGCALRNSCGGIVKSDETKPILQREGLAEACFSAVPTDPVITVEVTIPRVLETLKGHGRLGTYAKP